MPVTQSPVTPYLKACGPPAFVAIMPPSWDCSGAPGSGGKYTPFSRARRAIVAVVTPASASIRHSSGANERTRAQPLERQRDHVAHPCRSTAAPPARPLRPPTGTIATSCS